jgi:hypothetical protein
MFTNKPWALNGQKLDHHHRPVGGSYVFPDFMVLFLIRKMRRIHGKMMV